MLCRNVRPLSPLWNDLTTLKCSHCGQGMKMTARAVKRSIGAILVLYLTAVLAGAVAYTGIVYFPSWRAAADRTYGMAFFLPILALVVFLWSRVWSECMEFEKPRQ